MIKNYDTDYIESHIVRLTIMWGEAKGYFDIKIDSGVNLGSAVLQTAIGAFERLLNVYQQKGVWESVNINRYLCYVDNDECICNMHIDAEYINNNCGCNYIEEDRTFEITLGNQAYITVDRVKEDVLDHIVSVEIIDYTETSFEEDED